MTPPPLSRRLRSTLFLALRAAFRAVPMSEAQRDQLRSRFLRRFPGVRPLPAQGQVVGATERRPRVRADEHCIGYVEYSEEPLPDPLPATLVAFYLPQFHTIPENDEWWGKGFTEWRNVTRALPQFEGHLQPRLPGDLGFYDLRNPQVMRDQAKLAKTYGLSAFCFYFYWFGGKTLLEEPLRNWLNDKSIDFQYCLCWANENWTRRWDGRDDEVLIAQKHSPEDDIAFIQHVAEYLHDPRYLRVDGKPILLLYRPMLLPDAKATAERWRSWCRENGIGEIHLAYVQSFERPDPRDIGFDAAVEFPPNLAEVDDITQDATLLNPDYAGTVLDWRSMARSFMARSDPGYSVHRGVNCGWDNEARRPGRGRSLRHAQPGLYGAWLRKAMEASGTGAPVFINAWNEWAEGAVLEPDARHGHAWLGATRAAFKQRSGGVRGCVVIHAWYAEEFGELLDELEVTDNRLPVFITTASERKAAVENALLMRRMNAQVQAFDNRGRDILPFLHLVPHLKQAGFTHALKLHTKRSPHLADGRGWRRAMTRSLLSHGTPDVASLFAARPDLGLLAPERALLELDAHWGANEARVRELARDCGARPGEIDATRFPAGSMYWIRLDGLDPLLDCPGLGIAAFEEEQGQIDGTLAHAVERLLGISMMLADLGMLEISDLEPR